MMERLPENDTELAIFQNNIKFLRKKENLSKKDMAKLLQISVNSLNKIESGIMPERFRIGIVFRIQQVFGVLPREQFQHIDTQSNPRQTLTGVAFYIPLRRKYYISDSAFPSCKSNRKIFCSPFSV